MRFPRFSERITGVFLSFFDFIKNFWYNFITKEQEKPVEKKELPLNFQMNNRSGKDVISIEKYNLSIDLDYNYKFQCEDNCYKVFDGDANIWESSANDFVDETANKIISLCS